MRSATAFLLVWVILVVNCCAGIAPVALDLPTLPDAPNRPGWPAFLVLQPNIPPEVEICTWDGSVLSCITMKELRILLKARQRA